MKLYSAFEFKDFIICTGYKSESIRQYFRDFETSNLDFTINIGNQSAAISHDQLEESGWSVTVADTGSQTMTGGRILRSMKYIGNETFMCTYGDGLANVDLSALIKFHKSHGRIATLTCVQPPSRFGILNLDKSSKVQSFEEKPQTQDWVNGGFFVFEPRIFDYLEPNSVLEQEPLRSLAEQGELMAFKHTGYWQPMDTYRETVMLNELWQNGNAPWKVW
jgi:glucose-1-phosphate cytidylyltransferase